MGGHASNIKVTIQKDGSVCVEDDGRGIPIDYKPESGMSALSQVFLKAHAGGKFSAGAYSSSGGLHGIGLKCTNAYSESVEVVVRRHGLKFVQKFKNGGTPATDVEIYNGQKKIGAILESTLLELDGDGMATNVTVDGKKVTVAPGKKQSGTAMFSPRPSIFCQGSGVEKPPQIGPLEYFAPGSQVPRVYLSVSWGKDHFP